MKRTNYFIRIPFALCICLLLLSFGQTCFAAPRAVERVIATETDSGTEIEFLFTVPMQYQSHYPANNGKEVQVEMQALFTGQDPFDLENRFNPNWTRVKNDPLEDISYEQDLSGRVRLMIRFKQSVEFDLPGSSDPRRLLIQVAAIASSDVDPQEKPQPEVATPTKLISSSPVVVKPAETQPDKQQPLKRYAINLRSSLQKIALDQLPLQDLLSQHQLYTTTTIKNGRTWYRLRLGFFANAAAAEQLFAKLQKNYPEAWITKAPKSDHLVAQTNSLLAKVTTPTIQDPPARPGVAVTPKQTATDSTPPIPAETDMPSTIVAETMPVTTEATPDRKAPQLFTEAQAAMIGEDYRRAIQLYTKLTGSSDPAVQQQAQEYLALARERNGQLAHAKAEYERYIASYPEGEGTERVKQRLAGMLTARSTPKQKRRKAKQQVENKWETDLYGSFSQFYDRDVTYTQADESIINRKSLRTDLDFSARIRNENLEFNTTFIGGLENDFLEDGEDDFRISSLYLDAYSHPANLQARIGRQSRSTGGVLGRFDGGLLRWQAHDKFAINLVAGFPVSSTTVTEIDTDRYLYGLSLDLGTFAKNWDFNTYIIQQNVKKLIDRRAVGGEVRYFSRAFSFFSLIDYDIYYNELNTALMTANYRLPSKTALNLSIDYRNSPVQTTSNALIGQTAQSIEELLKSFSEEEIRQLARDRTATSRSYTFGITQPINTKLQISADATAAKFSSTPASGGVEAQPGTDYEYFYSMQLVGSSLIKEGDIAIIGLRYSDTDRSNSYGASVNTRYPITREFRVNPRALLDFRTNKNDDGEQWKFRPLLRLEYIWKRRYNFELEGGWEWSSEQLAGQLDDREGYFFTLGYRLNF